MNRAAILDAPAYSIPEAARYLGLPDATLRAWVMGRDYPIAGGKRRSRAVIAAADPKRRFLSFTNLVEAHVLSSIRRRHAVSLGNVRKAVDFLRTRLGTQRPLADRQLETDGIDLVVDELVRLINASREGQTAMRAVLALHLRRVERDPRGVPIRLYPFTRSTPDGESPRPVVIDPAVSFGRPVVRRLGVPTAAIAERYKAGERIAALAADYGAQPDEIEEAIRSELGLHAA